MAHTAAVQAALLSAPDPDALFWRVHGQTRRRRARYVYTGDGGRWRFRRHAGWQAELALISAPDSLLRLPDEALDRSRDAALRRLLWRRDPGRPFVIAPNASSREEIAEEDGWHETDALILGLLAEAEARLSEYDGFARGALSSGYAVTWSGEDSDTIGSAGRRRIWASVAPPGVNWSGKPRSEPARSELKREGVLVYLLRPRPRWHSRVEKQLVVLAAVIALEHLPDYRIKDAIGVSEGMVRAWRAKVRMLSSAEKEAVLQHFFASLAKAA